MSTAVQVGAQADETVLFRANEDLRTAGTETTAARPVAKTMCASVANSPIVRTLLLLVVVALLLYVIERLSGVGSSDGGKEALAEVLRSVLKVGVQQAVAMPVLELHNTTNTTLQQ